MTVIGIEQFLLKPYESITSGGGPTILVRFNVHLCVAAKVKSLLVLIPSEQLLQARSNLLPVTEGS